MGNRGAFHIIFGRQGGPPQKWFAKKKKEKEIKVTSISGCTFLELKKTIYNFIYLIKSGHHSPKN
jgi:hypothetical protein